MKKLLLLTSIIILAGILTACSSGGNTEDSAIAIESYLTALADIQQDTLINLSCAAWEASALTESQAYYGVETRLDEIACTFTETDGDFAVVSCEGNIIATYSGEDAPFPLDARQYLSIEEGGEWRMCGYR